jgi:hypothetical protein
MRPAIEAGNEGAMADRDLPRIPRPPSRRFFRRQPRPSDESVLVIGGRRIPLGGPHPDFKPVSLRAARLLANFSGWNRGPLNAEQQHQLLAALDNPREEWEHAAHIELHQGALNLWRAVAAVNPAFPREWHPAALARRIPDQLTVARALRYARQYVATPPWHRER